MGGGAGRAFRWCAGPAPRGTAAAAPCRAAEEARPAPLHHPLAGRTYNQSPLLRTAGMHKQMAAERSALELCTGISAADAVCTCGSRRCRTGVLRIIGCSQPSRLNLLRGSARSRRPNSGVHLVAWHPPPNQLGQCCAERSTARSYVILGHIPGGLPSSRPGRLAASATRAGLEIVRMIFSDSAQYSPCAGSHGLCPGACIAWMASRFWESHTTAPTIVGR